MPPPADDRMRYNFLAMGECAIAINNFVGSMNGHLAGVETQLEAKMNAPGSEWDGSARAEYLNAKFVWNNAADRIETLLRDIAGGVDEASCNMAGLEQSCANSFEWA